MPSVKFTANPMRAAAWVRVRELLEKKERGDTVTVSEIASAGSPFGLDSTMRSRIRRWFARERGIELIAVPGNGYRLASGEEHVHEVARGHQRRRLHHTRRAVRALTTAPTEDLSDATLVRRDAMVGREMHTLQILRDNERDYRQLKGKVSK